MGMEHNENKSQLGSEPDSTIVIPETTAATMTNSGQ